MDLMTRTKTFLQARVAPGERGSELVEFALSISIVLASIFAVMYFTLALYADHYVANAAKEGARYAMVRGSSWNGAACATTYSFSCTATKANVTSFVESTLTPGLTADNLTVTTSWPGTTSSGQTCDTTDGNNSPYCIVGVQVSYSFDSFLPFLPQQTIKLSSTSTVTISE
jgi:Flp pilus assembly protein TadG